MIKTRDLIRENRKREVWKKHCGYINLSMKDYMEIQCRLMLEQLNLLENSTIGKEIMGDNTPTSIAEFRETVPLTTYKDYAKYLNEKDESALPVKPYTWVRTSGKTSPSGYKRIPYTKQMSVVLGDATITALLLASCSQKGDVKLERYDKLLLATAPPPYVSGLTAYSAEDQAEIKFLPSLAEGDQMEFGERIAEGFKLAMREGLDYFYGIASVLAAMGERFESSSDSTKPSKDMLDPQVLWRLIKALVTSKISRRGLLPKDIWKVKGIVTGGMDTSVYKDRIKYYWGRMPLEGYGITEGGGMALQGWNYNGMMFIPDGNFLEFIPFEEHQKGLADPNYQPKTVLMDELEVGIYELAFSNFHGGTLIRYRPGDLFEVIAIGDDEIESELPQFKFYSRTTDYIDLAGMARMTEKDILTAIHESGTPFQDWVAKKETHSGEPILHLYIEPKANQTFTEDEAIGKIDGRLRDLLSDYKDMKTILGKDQLRVSLLPEGAFARYLEEQQAAGADLAHLKPPRMEPSDEILERLKRK